MSSSSKSSLVFGDVLVVPGGCNCARVIFPGKEETFAVSRLRFFDIVFTPESRKLFFNSIPIGVEQMDQSLVFAHT